MDLDKLFNISTDEIDNTDLLYDDEVIEIRDLIQNEYSGPVYGLPFRIVKEWRSDSGDHDSYHWVFQWGDKFYQVDGTYHSDYGIEMYCNSPKHITEVKEVTKEIKVWTPV